MSEFITKSSDEQDKFPSGAQRDSSSGKTRPDLIPVKAVRRWGDLMARGANHYGERNWELGMPISRFLESLERHLLNYKEGERTEDHLAAILFNVGAMIHFEGTEWDDLNEVPPGVPLRAVITTAAPIDESYQDFYARIGAVPCEQLEEHSKWCQDSFWDRYDNGDLSFDPTLQPADGSMINWDKLRKDVASGQIDGDTVNWPHDQAPKA